MNFFSCCYDFFMYLVFHFSKFVNALLPNQIIEKVAISQRIVSFLMRSDFVSINLEFF